MEPRLVPVERPTNPLLRLAYRLSEKQFGKVIGPLKVIYSRKPRLLVLAAQIHRTLEHGLSLEPSLRLLVQAQAARLNGCAFCDDLALAQAVRARMGPERFQALEDFRGSDLFTAREKAALTFAEEATRTRDVSEETFAELRRHFEETEIVELAWVNAVENYFNLQAHPLRIGSDELLALAAGRTHPGARSFP
jgi:alkylhydroperoxidase family enzyme